MIREQGAVDVIPRKAIRKRPAEFGAETDQERTKHRALPWQVEILVPPHRNPLREDITKRPVDD